MTDRKVMERALSLAAEAARDGEVPVGAVIVKNGEVIGEGRNRREKGKNALLHAEIEAIAKACDNIGSWRLNESELFVTLEPCPMCAGAIINSRIGRLVFGAYDERGGACVSVASLFDLPFESRPQVIGGYMQEECQKILTDFFAERRKG